MLTYDKLLRDCTACQPNRNETEDLHLALSDGLTFS